MRARYWEIAYLNLGRSTDNFIKAILRYSALCIPSPEEVNALRIRCRRGSHPDPGLVREH